MIKQLGVLGDVLRKRSNLHLHLDLSLLSVSRLEKGLFHNCVALQSVVLPNNCWVVGSHCFAGCKNLTQVTLSQELVSLGMFSFDACHKLEKVVFLKNLRLLENIASVAVLPCLLWSFLLWYRTCTIIALQDVQN